MEDLHELRVRFRGCLLGGAVGDALGMPTEVGPSREAGVSIHDACGVKRVEGYLDSPNPRYLRAGQYSDDTQQTICLGETLLERDGHFDAGLFYQKLSRAVTAFNRGVGPSTRRIITAMAEGRRDALLRGEATSQAPTNGGAMRIAPVALLFFWDTSRLLRIAAAATRATHAHPTSVAGACVQALLLAAVLRGEVSLDPAPLRRRIACEVEALDPALARLVAAGRGPREAGDTCGVMDTVPVVVASFLARPCDFREGVLQQVNSDGDTDTKAAMLGQLLGAHGGEGVIPREWLAGLEDGHRGRTYLRLLADALLQLSVRLRAHG